MHPFGCSIYRSASAFAVRYAAKAARYAPLRAREPTDNPKFEKINEVIIMQDRTLGNTGLTVSEIADASGFYDVAYFSSYFKKHFGITPTKYKMG